MPKRKTNVKERINTKLKAGDPVLAFFWDKTRRTKGKIKEIDYEKGTVLMEGVNLVKKHRKPKKQDEKGEIISIPAPVHISNVMYYSSKLDKGLRLSYKIMKDGSKVRYNRKHDVVID